MFSEQIRRMNDAEALIDQMFITRRHMKLLKRALVNQQNETQTKLALLDELDALKSEILKSI